MRTFPIASMGGSRYVLTFIEDYSQNVWIYTIKNKSDVFDTFKRWKAMVERQTEKKVKIFRTDNGLKFCSTEFDNFFKSEGIIRHRTTKGTPQQNGVIEHMNHTLLERVRSMLSSSGLSRDFWIEVAHTACYIINRSPV